MTQAQPQSQGPNVAAAIANRLRYGDKALRQRSIEERERPLRQLELYDVMHHDAVACPTCGMPHVGIDRAALLRWFEKWYPGELRK